MRLSHFARLEVIVPPTDYEAGSKGKSAILKTVGMAQSINVDDAFGSRAENTIGSPLPILAPGYQQTTIRIEKATIDGDDFRNLGAFNPLWAHVGKTYNSTVGMNDSVFELSDAASNGMYPFMFVLRVRNRVAASSTLSDILQGEDSFADNAIPIGAPGGTSSNRKSNSFGMYACVVQSATISATSQQAVIMDNITSIARPIKGTWLNDKLREAFNDQSSGARNGMGNVIYDVLYGYIPD